MATKKTSRGSVSKSERKPRKSQSAKIQAALYQIADAASAVTDMQSFYERLHKIVGRLMYARNFFIALYDEKSDLITWPYHADVKDTDDVWGPQSMTDHRGGTAYLLRNGQTLWMKRDYERMLKSGQFEQTGPTSADFIGIPLKNDDQILGALVIQSYTSRHTYTKQDVEVLSFVAQHISTALTRVRAIEETRQRNAELAILNSVGEAMSKTLDVKTVTKIVGDKVRDIFAADQMGILLFERQANLIHVLYGYDKAHDRYVDDTMIKPIPLGKGLTSKVIELRQPLLLSTREEQDAHGHYMPPELAGQIKMSESWLGVPIMVEEDVLGAVFVEDYRPHAYNESHLRLLQTLASNMGVAIQNARLFDETQQRNAELAIINSVQEGLASKLEMQGIYELVGEKLREIFDYQDVGIYSFDLKTRFMTIEYAFEKGQRIGRVSVPMNSLYDFIVAAGKYFVFNGDFPQFATQFKDYQVSVGELPKSALVVPVPRKRDADLAVYLALEDVEGGRVFSESDVRLLQTLANSMSVALENARLWEQEKLFRKALQRELEIGREIQQGFLPEALPQVAGWEIAASLMSAREVAGDFYDAFELPDGNIGLVIADVCDKGVGAALFMTLFRSLIRAAANLDYFEQTEKADAPHSSAERLQRAISLTNNYIAETHGGSGMFATLFFGILDPRDGKLTYINGGHESPLIVRADAALESLPRTGPAVGVLSNFQFAILETHLQAGDTFFAFTDGVPDCQNPRGEFFGRERLNEFLQGNRSAHETVDAMQADLRQYIDSANQFDDITLLAVRRV